MRSLALLIIVSAGFFGCGPTTKCGPGNCSGCCDASGTCQTGDSNVACGSGGLLCAGCSQGLTCNVGLCSTVGGTGGGSGGANGGGGGGATGGGGGYAAWCASYYSSFCDFAVRCGVWTSASVCRNYYSGVNNPCAPNAAIRDGRTVFDSSLGANCLSMLSSAACDGAVGVAGCSAVRGTLPLDAGCYGANECDPSLSCETLNRCPGNCRPITPIGQRSPTGECAAGAYAYEGTCLALTPIGQSCAPMGTETMQHRCVANAFCSAGLCTAKRLSGQSCDSSTDCAGILQCSGGFCGPLAALSSPCGTSGCQAGLKCSANICVAAGAINSNCMTSSQCTPDLICDRPSAANGTCQPAHTLGQSCTYAGFECGPLNPESLYCTATSTTMSGVCARRKGTGSGCQRSEECASSYCINMLCAGCVDPTP